MIKPEKPRKPKKPKPAKPTRSITDIYYLYQVTEWKGEYPDGKSVTSYQLIEDDLIPMAYFDNDGREVSKEDYDDETGYSDYAGDYAKIENIQLTDLLNLLKENSIDIKDVEVDNEFYYRKNNGQLILRVARQLSDQDYNNWVKNNEDQMKQYELDMEKYPKFLAQYEKLKKKWDIFQTEKKLKELKAK